jgi:hypothetical protein
MGSFFVWQGIRQYPFGGFPDIFERVRVFRVVRRVDDLQAVSDAISGFGDESF